MAVYPTGGGDREFELVPPGTHTAVCVLIADVGIQPGGNFGPKHKVLFMFETPDNRTSDSNKPLIITERHTASMNKKANMRLMLEGWRGASFTDEDAATFDVRKVLGRPCLVGVVHNKSGDKTYANITQVLALPKGMPVPKAEAPLIYYGPDDDSDYDKLPPWVKKLVDGQLAPEKAPSREAMDDAMADQAGGGGFEDEIPFAPLHKRAIWF